MCDAKLAESAETLRRWSANALVHRWGVAESFTDRPQFPRTQRWCGESSRAFLDDFMQSLSSSKSRSKAIWSNIILAHEKILHEQTQLPLSSRPSQLNLLFFVTTYMRCRLPTMQKSMFDWTRCYTEHQSALWWILLPCWPDHYVMLKKQALLYNGIDNDGQMELKLTR